MGEPQWTDQQKNAIEASGGTLLVSAAAGSGKTAVLVERLKRKIADKDNPCSVDSFLVVTFTNAAAANMKTKIAKALSKAIKENPGSAWLRSQLNLLPFAKISTIDKFCINLVRDNFHALDISPDFRIIEGGRDAVLQNEALNTVLDNYAVLSPDGYEQMLGIICDAKDDNKVAEAIKDIYIKSQAYPFPDERLDYLIDVYKTDAPFEKTVWGEVAYSYIEKVLQYCISMVEKALSVCEKHRGEYDEPIMLREDYNNYLSVLESLPTASWGELCKKCCSVVFIDWSAKKDCGDKAYLKELRTAARDKFRNKIIDVFFNETQEQIDCDRREILPALGCLVSMVRDFEKEYSALKKKENYLDFNDTLHYSIKLLCKKDENGAIIKDENGVPVAGELALELSKGFTEILVDEYQDVNEAQELLFRLLSRDGSNLFMVGDVKQSIYGFREAMPELFLEKQKSFAKYDGKTFPSTVVLSKNFRSVKGITEIINHIFSRIMIDGVGGLEYNEDHYLNYNEKAHIEHDEADTEIHFVRNGEDETEAEIQYLADYIEQNIGTLIVKDEKGDRPAVAGDFAVLLRSVSDGYAERLNEVLKMRGITALLNLDNSFFDAPEVRFMLALLRTISNPLDDVSLLAVMLSPVYGFTPDDVAQIKIDMRKRDTKVKKLFYAVQNSANTGDEKSKTFLDAIERFRNISYTVGAQQLLQILLDETGYFPVVSVLTDAAARTNNLRLLCQYAASYESAGRVGLTGFLRYIERAQSTQISVKTQEEQGINAVRIMTIHGSKGLEFPVVVLANCSKQIRTRAKSITFSRRCGVGMYSGGKDFVRFTNVLRTVTGIEAAETDRAEELRNLYVALTRAKQKLLIVSSYPQFAKNSKEKPGSAFTAADITFGRQFLPYSVLSAGHSIDLIASALLNHPDAVLLREMQADYAPYIDIDFKNDSKLRVINVDYELKQEEQPAQEQTQEDISELVYEIRKRAEYVYPYAGLEGKAAKRVASDFAAAHESGDYTATRVPVFLSGEELSPAQIGTATHKFMQFCRFDTDDVEKELDRVVEEGLMLRHEADAVDKEKIRTFLSGDLAARVIASPAVYREKCFTCGVKAGEVYPDLHGEEAQETVIVDGVADLAFVEDGALVIVDYKTDGRVTDEILRGRYSGQLKIYARCLAELLDIDVKETLIYSFSLGKTVEITQ